MTKLTSCFFMYCLFMCSIPATLYAQQPQESLVVVVSSKQSIAALNPHQIENLFMGLSSVFPDGSPAIPVDHAENSAIWQQFYRDVLGRSAAQIRSHWARQVFTGRGRPPRTVNSYGELLELMAEDTRIISYIYARSLTPDIKVVFE